MNLARGNLFIFLSLLSSLWITGCESSNIQGNFSSATQRTSTDSGTSTSTTTPVIISVNPTSASIAVSKSIVIYGSGFDANSTVTIGGLTCTVDTTNSTSSALICTTGTSSDLTLVGAATIVVTHSNGNAGSKQGLFTYLGLPPLISSTAPAISPSQVEVGVDTVITINGSNLVSGTSGTTVKLGTFTCSNPFYNGTPPTSVSCTASSNTIGAVSVTLTNSDGQTATSANAVTFYAAAPTISAVTPTSGGSNTTITVSSGANDFVAGATVTVGGETCTNVSVTSGGGSLTCTTPSNLPGLADIIVTNIDNQASTPFSGYTYQMVGNSLSAGGSHACSLINGGVRCWGDNSSNQLGNGGVGATQLIPYSVTNLSSGVHQVSSGTAYSCAVADGSAKCWGENSYGFLGNNNNTTQSTPVQVLGLTEGVQSISTGDTHSCSIINGGISCWGQNNYGQIGNNAVGDSTGGNGVQVPTAVEGLSSEAGAQSVSTNGTTTCALVNGGVQCWGRNDQYQLGSNDTMSAYKESPVAVTGLSTGSGTQAIGVGTKHACALVNGGVKCWGDNSQGQLGNNTPITSPTAVPVNVTGLTSGVQALAVGPYHNCALVNGGIQCWGKNDKGQTGTVGGSGLYESLPVAVNGITSNARSISAGTGYTCALVNHGIKCWGDNSLSQLGDNSATTPTLPVNPYGASQGISQMAAGSTHTCIIVNGGVKCWGLNSAGQIGDNSTTDRHIPTSVYGLTAGAQTLSAGNLYSCSLVNGGVQCWGDNSLGQTGQSSPTTGNIVPASVYSLTSEVQMMASGKNQSCALVNGGVKCWGSNVSGQLGNNTTGGSSALPVSVTNLTANVNSIAVGESHACALVGGGVKCWGSNSKGQLGDNSTTDSSIPVAVTGLSSGGVTAIAAGSSHTCALVNGGVQCWGYNASGQLGDNSTTDSLVPVQVTALSAAGVTTVVTGASHSCAISQGGIQCWGDNSSGQIGANSVTASFLVPTAVLGLSTGVQELSSGDNHVCALYNGTLKCWGNNTYGQLGNNSTTLLRAPASISGL